MLKPVQHTTLINVLMSVSFLLFTYGVFSPLMTVKKWFIVVQTFSLLIGLIQFVHARQYVLFAIVLTFALVMPLAKMILVAIVTNTALWTPARNVKMLQWLSLCGKWAMMDVFIVAILVVIGKFRGIAAVEIHSGLYAFTASVILIHIATCRLHTLLQRAAQQPAPVAEEYRPF